MHVRKPLQTLKVHDVSATLQSICESTKFLQKYWDHQKVPKSMFGQTLFLNECYHRKFTNCYVDMYLQIIFLLSDVKVQSISECAKFIWKYCLCPPKSTLKETCDFKLQWLFCSHTHCSQGLSIEHFSFFMQICLKSWWAHVNIDQQVDLPWVCVLSLEAQEQQQQVPHLLLWDDLHDVWLGDCWGEELSKAVGLAQVWEAVWGNSGPADGLDKSYIS